MQSYRTLTLIPTTTLRGAATVVGDAQSIPFGTSVLAVQATFVRAGGGTTCTVYVQTSLDGGTTWMDVANLAFTTTTATKVSVVKVGIAVAAGVTPGDGALSDNSILDGVLGDRVRVKYVVVGDYTGASTLAVTAVAN